MDPKKQLGTPQKSASENLVSADAGQIHLPK